MTLQDAADDVTMNFPDEARADPGVRSIAPDRILGIPVVVDVILGSTKMPISNLMKLKQGLVVPLDRKIGEPVDIAVNGSIVARGEVVVLDDDPSQLGVSLVEVLGES